MFTANEHFLFYSLEQYMSSIRHYYNSLINFLYLRIPVINFK